MMKAQVMTNPSGFFSRENAKLALLGLIVLAAFLLVPGAAHAAEGTGGGLPYEGWLGSLRDSITGPFAFTVAVIGIVVAGAVLIFGGELNDFARRLTYVALVGGILLGATQIVALFGSTGASIGTPLAPAQAATPVSSHGGAGEGTDG